MQCSLTCGEGIQTRTVLCYDTANDMTVDVSNCDGVPPTTERACFGPECPCKYMWGRGGGGL